ncbi:MAG: hypothetical protein SVE93_06225 [Candidatus Thermoplasmatota archaeon]|nr:hypothetical protein [Candidatus Thermoplasmatota archaeon]
MIERMEIRGIEGRRYVELAEAKSYKISVNHSTTILNVTKDGEKASVDFSFSTNFLPIGMVRVEGRMLYSGNVDALVRSWGSSKKIEDKDIAKELMNAPMAYCMPTIFMLSKELNLPPPLPIPRMKFEGKDEDKQAYL